MDRFTIALTAGVLALVVAGVAVAGSLRGHDAPLDLNTPGGIVLAYALAEQRGDPEAAWNLLSASTQARASHDEFLARASHVQNERELLSVEDERISDDSAGVVLVRMSSATSGGLLLGGGGTYTTRSTVRLAREPGGWRITVPPDPWTLSAR